MLSPVLKITFRAERRFEMAYVTVPKDLTKIKSKVMFNLTKRQLVCFSAAVAIGLPLFFLVKGSVGTSAAALCMVLAIEFEDINYQLAQPDDKTAIFEALCDMYNSFDACGATVGICAVLSFGIRETPCRKARGTDRRAAMNMCFCLPSRRNITTIGKQ